MILFTILAILTIVAIIVAVVLAGVFGGATLIAVGDIIVCVLILWGIFRLIFRRRK